MIGKKVRNPGKSATLSVRVHRLADYIDRPESPVPADRADDLHDAKAGRVAGLADYTQRPLAGQTREKCIYSGARGFLATDRAARKVEMLGLARASVHSKDPINHYVLSWPQGEQPTPAQVEEAVDLFLDEMELTGHQTFYGLHVDTDNVHLHLMVNRVHPATRKVVQSNKGFDLEALHRAVARIEHAQGWRREERGRYRVQADGAVRRDYHSESARPPTGKRAAGGGHRFHASGAKSAERIAREEGAPLIRSAASWAELHERLAARGLRYQRKGSGALLWVGDVAVKASRAGRDCSLRAVERRLGDCQPARESLPVAVRPPEPDRSDASRWSEYHAARGAYHAGKRDDTRTLRDRLAAERRDLLRVHREQRDTLFQSVPPGGWRGRGGELNARRSLLAARQAGERAALRDRQQREWVAVRARWRDGFSERRRAGWRERESPERSKPPPGAADRPDPPGGGDRRSPSPRHPRFRRGRLRPAGGLPPGGRSRRAGRFRGPGPRDRGLRRTRPGHRAGGAATGRAEVGAVSGRGRRRVPGAVRPRGGGVRLAARRPRTASGSSAGGSGPTTGAGALNASRAGRSRPAAAGAAGRAGVAARRRAAGCALRGAPAPRPAPRRAAAIPAGGRAGGGRGRGASR